MAPRANAVPPVRRAHAERQGLRDPRAGLGQLGQPDRKGPRELRAQVTEARAQALPQLSANLGYTRTLASVFQQAAGPVEIPDSMRFEPDPTRPLEERVAYLEDRTDAVYLRAERSGRGNGREGFGSRLGGQGPGDRQADPVGGAAQGRVDLAVGRDGTAPLAAATHLDDGLLRARGA